MSTTGQELTKTVYEDPQIVSEYINQHQDNSFMDPAMIRFGESLHGKKIIDIGCGPGNHTRRFKQLGFAPVGVDYSEKMIEAAIAGSQKDIDFKVVDMKHLTETFAPNEFDGAWLAASLFHVPEEQTPQVLEQVKIIVKNGGKVFFLMKGGHQGTELITEEKYLKPISREFTFWTKENFEKLLKTHGFTIDHFEEDIRGKTGGNPTQWLFFFTTLTK